VEEFEREEIAARDRTLERLDPSGKAALFRKWWEEIDVGDWCGNYLRDSRTELGLSESEADWPQAKSIPSLWHFYSYRLARIKRTAGVDFRTFSSQMGPSGPSDGTDG